MDRTNKLVGCNIDCRRNEQIGGGSSITVPGLLERRSDDDDEVITGRVLEGKMPVIGSKYKRMIL